MQYLYDQALLKTLDAQRQRVLYIQIRVLNANESIVDTIEGICTGGSISLNAKSSMRRSGNLTMIATEDNKNITDVNNLISINKRIGIQIGIENNTAYYQTEEIFWFPLGIFIVSTANISKNQQGINISISFKDKMVLLNGEVGGDFSGEITHSPVYVEPTTDQEKYGAEAVRFYNLIYSLLNEFGGLRANEIIIDDVDTRIQNPVRYLGDNNTWWKYPNPEATGGNNPWVVVKGQPTDVSGAQALVYGETLGYFYTDFVYPVEKDLTSGAGETIESVLKKITQQLTNHEYFFDRNGIFHFQEIKNGLNQGSSKDNLEEALGEKYLASIDTDLMTYSFDDDESFVAIASAPVYSNIKNAYVVWGEKKGTKALIRYHLIIDTPPILSSQKTYTFYTRSQAYFVDGETVFYTRGYNTPVTGATQQSITLRPEDPWQIILYYELLTGAIQKPYGKEYLEEFPKAYDILNKTLSVSETDLVYYLDMLDPTKVNHPIVSQLGVQNIGYRLMSEKRDDINSVLPGITTPKILFVDSSSATAEEEKNSVVSGQVYQEVGTDFMAELSVADTVYSGYDYVRALLHNSTSYLDTITISCIPVYHLEPNQRIHVDDYDTGVHGDYIIQSMSIPLTVDGTMTISATRAIERV